MRVFLENPNQMLFKRDGCNDEGVRGGGWGSIVLEFSIVDREEKT